jgi:hypothetical protein
MNMRENDQDIERLPGFPNKETGFTVPEGYFESFSDRLKLRMQAETVEVANRNWKVYLRPMIGMAAGLAIIVTIYLHPFNNRKSLEIVGVAGTSLLSDEEQTDLLSNSYASSFSEGQFLSAISEMDEYDSSRLPTEALADYLASNCSDFEIINDGK